MRVIAYLQEPLSNAGSRCRIAALAPGLASRGIELHLCPPMSDARALRLKAGGAMGRAMYYAVYLLGRLRDIPRAARADAAIVFRGMFPIGRPWMERVVTWLNRNLVYDFDDAVWLRPPFASRGYRWVDLNAPAKILRRAKAAVVGSPWLEEFARRHCSRVKVIPSCLEMSRLEPATRAAGAAPVVVGWIGSKSGFEYLHELDDVWRELQERHGIIFRVISNGQYEAPGLKVENIAWSLDEEVNALRSLDIGIMPLKETPFERGKAGFKLLQYMALGKAAVASPVGVNRDFCGKNQERALAATTTDEWREALERLITDAALRDELGTRAREWVRPRYDVSCAVDAWAQLLHEVVQAK